MRSLGYTRPLYLLPFDHRQSYVSGMFHFAPPLTTDERDIVIAPIDADATAIEDIDSGYDNYSRLA